MLSIMEKIKNIKKTASKKQENKAVVKEKKVIKKENNSKLDEQALLAKNISSGKM